MRPHSKTRWTSALAAFAIVAGWNASWADAPTRTDEPARQEKKDEPKKPEAKKDEAWPTVESGAKAELGKAALDFTLKDLDGKDVKLSSFKGKLIVLEWFSPGCPMCDWAYGDGPLKEMHARLTKEGVVWLAVNSEDPAQPASTVEKNKAFLEKKKADPRVVLDPTGAVGKAYGAKTTPHMFLIDEKGLLVYQGALDNAPFGQLEKDAKRISYVDVAIQEIKAGKPVTTPKTAAYG